MRRASAAAIAVGEGPARALRTPRNRNGMRRLGAGEAAVAASDCRGRAEDRARACPGVTRRQPKLSRGREGLDSRSMRRVEHGQKGADGDVAKASGRFGASRERGAVRRASLRGLPAAAAFAPSKSAAKAIPFATTRRMHGSIVGAHVSFCQPRRRHALSHIGKRRRPHGKNGAAGVSGQRLNHHAAASPIMSSAMPLSFIFR